MFVLQCFSRIIGKITKFEKFKFKTIWWKQKNLKNILWGCP